MAFAALVASFAVDGVATRPIYFNVENPANQITMYVLFGLSMIIMLNGLIQRVILWRAGPRDGAHQGRIGQRLRHFIVDVLLQRKVARERFGAIVHGLIFVGFLVLLVTTSAVFLEHDLGLPVFRGTPYLALTLASDIFGFAFLLAILAALARRFVLRPKRLHTTSSNIVMLALLALLLIQGFGLEALRLHLQPDPWKHYSPVGYALSFVFTGLAESGARTAHFLLWWFHTLTVFVFLALLPYTKLLHLFSSSANLVLQDTQRQKGALSFPGDLAVALEAEDAENFRLGRETFQDLTWKERLDLDACTSCGRCQDACPAYRSGKVLSPKWLVLDLQEHMLRLQSRGFLSSAAGPRLQRLLQRIDRFLLRIVSLGQTQRPALRTDADNAYFPGRRATRELGAAPDAAIAGDVLDPDLFWSCTTCRACMEVCPVGIEHVDLIAEVRRSLVLMRGEMPTELGSTLRTLESQQNPFGPSSNRFDWAGGLDVPQIGAGESTEVLYWIGCISAFDRRKQRIAQAMVQIFNHAGISWATLGPQECCTGDPARRIGEEMLYQNLAHSNLSTLQAVQFKTLVTHCPHCFNTFANEYQALDSQGVLLEKRIVHHSTFIRELLEQGKLSLSGLNTEAITFHDPCYLGRYNDVYDAPRQLVQLSSGKAPAEMADSREKALCCGAGGGHFFMDMKVGQRVNVLRAEQALATQASTVATACPFCLHMLEDGLALLDRTDVHVRDIAEIIAERLPQRS